MNAKRWMAAVLVLVAAWTLPALGAGVELKGVKPGDHIEKAHEQFKARMPAGVEVSEIVPAGAGDARQFAVDGENGLVLGDDHDRVQYLRFSGELCVKLFGLVAASPEEFAVVLSAAWGLSPTAWTASWSEMEDGTEVTYWRATAGNCVVTLDPWGGLSVKRMQRRDIRRVLR